MSFLVNFFLGLIFSLIVLLGILFGMYYWGLLAMSITNYFFGNKGFFSFLVCVVIIMSPITGLAFALDMKMKP